MARKISLRRINNILALLLLILVVFNLYQTIKLKQKFGTPQETKAEEVKKRAVTATLVLDSSCKECSNLSATVQQFKIVGVNVTKQKVVESSSNEGKALIQNYKIQILPTLIFSKELKDYADITSFWQQVGTVEKDGSYVTRSIMPPYVNLTTGKTAGIVELIMLTDKSCGECYNATEHLPILESFGIALGKKESTDISSNEGKELLEKYSITNVPTIILSQEAKYYSSLEASWKPVGTIETDGTFVFRNFSSWTNHTYKDLTTGKVVTS